MSSGKRRKIVAALSRVQSCSMTKTLEHRQSGGNPNNKSRGRRTDSNSVQIHTIPIPAEDLKEELDEHEEEEEEGGGQVLGIEMERDEVIPLYPLYMHKNADNVLT